jgi:hypothetical protein
VIDEIKRIIKQSEILKYGWIDFMEAVTVKVRVVLTKRQGR